MLIELPPGRRAPLRPLFAGLPGLHGCLDAAIDGGMGGAWADDTEPPSVGVIHLDFYFLAGDAGVPGAEEAVARVEGRASIVASNAGWEPLLRERFGEALKQRTRIAFKPGLWDRARLRGFIDALPEGLAVRRIERADAERFAELADSLVYNFDSLDDFIERGAGFGIEHEGHFISGCSSFAISPHSLEFEIQTHPDFRRRGLATAAAAAMIDYCIDAGLRPEWDAHNEMSAALAGKLGFTDPAPYTAYEIRS
jgi:GNAT superfamily N-acetyltransferase